jgi:ketol-acid reductoisomerase
MKNLITELENEVKNAQTPTVNGRQIVANACKKLYEAIEECLYNKYGEEAIKDAYKDLCNGNFAEPFLCEQKKQKFELYKNIYLKIA